MVKQLNGDIWNAARPAGAAPVFPPPLGEHGEGEVVASSLAAAAPAPVLTPVRELVFRLKLRLARV